MSDSEQAKQRLSRVEFKTEASRKGWTFRALAERWGVSENWVHKLASDPERKLHWDDAVRGLPLVMKQRK